MPKEYIEREAALRGVNEFYHEPKVDIVLKQIPAADVVEVVRCGECVHHSRAITPGRVICDKHAIPRNDTDFCSDGRRDKPEN